MADNIGLMADRIIITQQIQSDNFALTQASILTTQSNALSLVSMTNTNAYTVELNSILFFFVLKSHLAYLIIPHF